MHNPTFKAIIPPPKSASRDFNDLESALAWLSETGNGYVMEQRQRGGEWHAVAAVKDSAVITPEQLAVNVEAAR